MIQDEQIGFDGTTAIGSGAAASFAIENGAAATFGTLDHAIRGLGGTTPTAHTVGATVRLVTLQCSGDCDGSFTVTVDELVKGVKIALGTEVLSACPAFDRNHDRRVTVDELVLAVGSALNGC